MIRFGVHLMNTPFLQIIRKTPLAFSLLGGGIMKESKRSLSRRGFIQGVGGGALGAAALSCGPVQAAPTPDEKARPNGAYYLVNVRLESGFIREGEEIVNTATELASLRIENGKIAEILTGDTKPGNPQLPRFDAGGQLLLPTFRDMHIHLDKTYYGGPWRAVRPMPGGVFDRIKEEQVLLPKLLATAEERTEKIIELMHKNGSTVVRSHCNIDPVQGLKNLEHLKNVLARHNKANDLTSEIVAFPQHGLLLSKVEGLMREAMKMGVDYVGGLDPTVIDGDMDKSIDTMVQIAVDANKGIDIHLHEGAPSGIKAIRRLMDVTEKAKLQGKMTISHAFSLAALSPEEGKEMYTRMADLGISIATSMPIGKWVMPIDQLLACNVNVICGTDSVIDWWSSFGMCDMLEKAKLAAELYGWRNEFNLSRTLGLATGKVTPLNAKGERVWPKVGNEASFNLLPASCSAEAIARLTERTAVFHNGVLAYGAVKQA